MSSNPEISLSSESFGNNNTTLLHVDSYFLVQKDPELVEQALKELGLTLEDFYSKQLPEWLRRSIGWDEVNADENGLFVFPKRTLVLAHTLEDVEVPDNTLLRMREFFVTTDRKPFKQIPLETNMTAPLIQPGFCGPQTFEIYSPHGDLKIKVADLACIVDILPLDRVPESTGKTRVNNFSVQKRGQIALGYIK